MLTLLFITCTIIFWLVFIDRPIAKIKVKEGKQFANLSSVASNQINELVLSFFDESEFTEDLNDESLKNSLIKKTKVKVESNLKDSYDVIIVGSGPSGASSAEKLVSEGFNVLMIESGNEHNRKNHARMDDFIQNDSYYQFPQWKYDYTGTDLDLNTWMVRYEGVSTNA